MAFVVGAGPYPEWPDIRMIWDFGGDGPRYVFWTMLDGDAVTYVVPALSSEDFNSVEQVKAAMNKAEAQLTIMVARLKTL